MKGLEEYLGRLNFEDFDVNEFLNRIQHDDVKVPTIGLTISGGGWSSGFTGTGALRAFDARFGPAAEQSVNQKLMERSSVLTSFELQTHWRHSAVHDLL